MHSIWCRLLQMPTHRYPRNCYLMLKAHGDTGRVNWASNVKTLLYKCGFVLVWLSQDVGDLTMFLHHIKQCVIDCCQQTWHSDVDISAKCIRYKHFNNLLNVERYITCSLPFNLRKAMAKFRCSNHKYY